MNPLHRNQICEALLNILGEINEIEELVQFDKWLDEQEFGEDTAHPDLEVVREEE